MKNIMSSNNIEMDNKIYCGTGKLPKNRILGSMQECIANGQIRQYGIQQIDKKTLEEDEQKKREAKNKRDAISKAKREAKAKPKAKPEIKKVVNETPVKKNTETEDYNLLFETMGITSKDVKREIIFGIRDLRERYGDDGMGDKPANMSSILYWGQHLDFDKIYKDVEKKTAKPATKPATKPTTMTIKLDYNDNSRKTSNESVKEKIIEKAIEALKKPKTEDNFKIDKHYDFGIDTNKFKIYSETNTQRELRRTKEGTKEHERLKKKSVTKAEQKRQQIRKDFIKLFTYYTKLRDENKNNKNDKEIMKVIEGSGLINLSSYMDMIEREDGLDHEQMRKMTT